LVIDAKLGMATASVQRRHSGTLTDGRPASLFDSRAKDRQFHENHRTLNKGVERLEMTTDWGFA
jgi:hypothetical protein